MKEKYFTRTEGDEVIVTRKSDRKTITFSKRDCTSQNAPGPIWRTAIALAKACDDATWG